MTRQLLFAILATISVGCAHAPTSQSRGTVATPSVHERLNAIADQMYLDQRYPGISLTIFFDDEAMYDRQIGYIDVIDELAPNRDTMFRIYSLSKGLTEILAATMVDSGHLDLDAPIASYVDDLPAHLRLITTRQLLRHQSGIRHYESNDEWLRLSQQTCSSPSDALSSFVHDPLLFPPGQQSHYSSFGYVLLSQVLEMAGGQPFHQLMAERVFQPSGGVRIEFDDPSGNQPPNTTRFYEPVGTGFVEAPFADNSCKFGGGGLNASPTAVAKAFSAFYAARLTRQNVLAEFVLEGPISLGGEGLGGRSALVAYPMDRLIVVILANARGGDLLQYAADLGEVVRNALPKQD